MGVDELILSIDKFGYAALFFLLWLGIVGMPIPDEVIVMTGGLVASLGLLKPVPAFIMTYLGVVSGLSLGYFLGRFMGEPVLKRLRKRKKMTVHVDKSFAMVDKYGPLSLLLSYFLPIVRHIVPYIVGFGKMPFYRYAIFSYSIGLIWTFLLFMAGYFFGNYIDVVGQTIERYGVHSVLVLMLILLLFIGLTVYLRRKRRWSR